MKTIGLIGGMSWESSLEYYRIVNEETKARLGPSHSCPCIMYSVDFARIETLQHRGDWETLAKQMIELAVCLQKAGADCIVLCTNTMHMMADAVQKAVTVPLLHIADAAAAEARRLGISKVGLMATKFTMEQPFYRERLQQHGITAVTPSEAERDLIHHIIYSELIAGNFQESSRQRMASIISHLAEEGCEAVVLGCTEIPLLVTPERSPLPTLDTTALHAKAAVKWALDKA